jgi:hypothetical protein
MDVTQSGIDRPSFLVRGHRSPHRKRSALEPQDEDPDAHQLVADALKVSHGNPPVMGR